MNYFNLLYINSKGQNTLKLVMFLNQSNFKYTFADFHFNSNVQSNHAPFY